MPIIDIQLVQPPSEPMAVGLAGRIADTLADTLAVPEGRLWVRLRGLSADGYAENGVTIAGPELPVFVSVLLSDLPPAEDLARHAQAVTTAVADAVARPRDRVHVEYAPAGRGRIAFGGRLVA